MKILITKLKDPTHQQVIDWSQARLVVPKRALPSSEFPAETIRFVTVSSMIATIKNNGDLFKEEFIAKRTGFYSGSSKILQLNWLKKFIKEKE